MTLENTEIVIDEPIVKPAIPDEQSQSQQNEQKPTEPEKKEDTVKTVFGEDWRQVIAGEDKSALKTLERLTDPKALFKVYKELRAQRDSGHLQVKLSDNPTPEELAEWKKQQGIPEKPEDYKIDLGKYVPTEADIPAFDDFKKYAHERNLPPSAVNAALNWYAERVQEAEAIQKQLDDSFRQNSDEVLREEWGPDFKANNNVIKNFLSTADRAFVESVEKARLDDGTRLADSPAFKQFIAKTALDINPAAKILPVNSSPSAHQDRIEAIEKMQRENYGAYMRDNKLQEEYYQLIAAREKMQSR